MRLEPPQGWAELQKRAKDARSPEELADVFDEMDRVLTEYEKKASHRSDREGFSVRSKAYAPKKTA